MTSLTSSVAQTRERQKFKHEKHGAIVFAKGDDYELKCDIYQPESDEPRPIMLAIHGGAWTTGTKFSMYRHARILANRGYVVMSFNYRLAPKHKWPAQIHDCKHAVRWIRQHAAEYNADPNRVYAFGYSAGGHLAAMLAATDEEDGLEGEAEGAYANHSTAVQGLIAGGAPTEFSWIGEDETTLKYWLGATKEDSPETYRNASPISFLSDEDPPMVLFHGTSDALVPYSAPQKFLERCKQKNIASELFLRNGGHIITFTSTTSFIVSLEKLEFILSEKNCRQKIAKLVALTKSYVSTHGNMPQSMEELGDFAIEKKELDKSAFENLRLNERDGKQFEIRWSLKDGVIVDEAEGVNGKKLSSRD